MNEAIKDDQNKIRMDLLPPDALNEIAKVLTYGANKYGKDNWANGFDYHRIYGALQRHLNAFWNGEDIDKDSNLSHLACAGANILILLSHTLRNIGNDDRVNKINNKVENKKIKDNNKNNNEDSLPRTFIINIDHIKYTIDEEKLINKDEYLYRIKGNNPNYPYFSQFYNKKRYSELELAEIIKKNRIEPKDKKSDFNIDIRESNNIKKHNANVFDFKFLEDNGLVKRITVDHYTKDNKNYYDFIDYYTKEKIFTKETDKLLSSVNAQKLYNDFYFSNKDKIEKTIKNNSNNKEFKVNKVIDENGYSISIKSKDGNINMIFTGNDINSMPNIDNIEECINRIK